MKQFLPSNSRSDTAIWMHYLDANNYTRMLRAILNKSWRQHPTKNQLYGHLPPITKIIQVRWTRHAGHCWISRDELISDVLLWTPTYGRAKAGRPARTYIQQLCEDTGCSPEDLPEAMNDREKWWERVRDIRAGGTTWWWWWSVWKWTQLRDWSLNSFTTMSLYCTLATTTRGLLLVVWAKIKAKESGHTYYFGDV